MPIDPSKALGATIPVSETQWTKDQVILYHLGIGAGVPATDPGELAYTYEKDLKVLPTFGVIPVFGSFIGGMAGVPGIDINPFMVLHGEQDLEVHKAIPVEAKVTNHAKIVAIYDKGKGAVIILEVDTRDEGGDTIWINRFSIFARGEGGFGGDPGPKAGNLAPERTPDYVKESPTLPQQALLYRLSGDKNPLHCDPEFAKMGGFDKPILHGLCTYGIVCKAVVDTVLGGDVSKLTRFQARFAGVIYPGETIVTSMWKEGGQVLLQAKSKERDAPVLTNAAVTLKS